MPTFFESLGSRESGFPKLEGLALSIPLQRIGVFGVIFVSLLAGPTFSSMGGEAEMLEVIRKLEQRIDHLEKRIADGEPPQTLSQSPATSVSQSPLPVLPSSGPAVDLSSKKSSGFSIGDRVPVKFKGFLKVDGLYTAGGVNSTDAPRFAVPHNDRVGFGDSFTGTIQHSRLAAAWEGVTLAGGEANALIEVDALNLNDLSDSSKFINNQTRMRLLYVSLKYTDWELLFGEAWDVFSPRNPKSLNTNGNLWFTGNAGFRRPQFRASRTFRIDEKQALDIVGSVNANVGVSQFSVDTDGDGVAERISQKSGEDSGVPVIQGAVKYSFAADSERARKFELGFSGVYGVEEVDARGTFGPYRDVDQWGMGVDFSIPLVSRLSLAGEWHIGENTDAFFMGGGITPAGEGVQSMGGWAQLVYDATSKIKIRLTYGLEDVDRSDLGIGGREKNQVFGAQSIYRLSSAIDIGLEYDHFTTDYLGAANAEADMVWSSMIFSF